VTSNTQEWKELRLRLLLLPNMSLDHIFRVIKIDSETCKALKEEGVTDLESLLEIEEEVRNEDLSLKAVQRKRIILYLDWSRAFYREHGREPEPLEDFDNTAFADYKLKRKHSVQLSEENALVVPMEDPEWYDLILAVLLSARTTKSLEKMVALSEAHRNKFTGWFVRDIQGLMPSQLVDACSHFEPQYIEFTERFVDKVFLTDDRTSYSGEKPSFPPFLVGGRTQAGKTSFKAVCALVCNKVEIPLIIITKGVAESKELYSKLLNFLDGTKMREHLVTPGRGRPRDYMVRALEKHGVVVIADTAAQITKAAGAVTTYRESSPERPFAVIVDECDDMYRTAGRTQKTEQAYDSLMGMDPSMKLMISATLVPLLVNMKNEEEDIGWLAFIEPLDDYVGIEAMVPLNLDGKEAFLSSGELGKNSHENIPYCNDKVLHFYKHALNIPETKGVLVLDVSCPKVYAEGNIFDKAAKVQRLHSKIIAVGICGRGIKYKTHIYEEWEEAEKGSRISDILDMLDDEYGLERPIFVFGFSKMQRGMSFRSSKRVPSHILLALGDGYSFEGMIQALGRATFNGKHLLLANGFKSVTVLIRDRDWDSAIAYQHFLGEIAKKVMSGNLDGAFQELYQWKSDFLHGNKRKCGKNKEFRGVLEEMAFEEAPSDDEEVRELRCGEHHAIEVLNRNCQAEMVLEVVIKCAKKYPLIDEASVRVRTEEIRAEYDDMWHEEIKKGQLTKALRWLYTNGFLKKFGGDEWKVMKRAAGKTLKKRRTE